MILGHHQVQKIFFILFFNPLLLSQVQNYPLIETLNDQDINFKQLTSEIQENNRRLNTKKPLLPLLFYGYQTIKGDSIYKVAARLNITYDSIATLNGIVSPLMFNDQQLIFLPNMNGLTIRSDEKDAFLSSVAKRIGLQEAITANLHLQSGTIKTLFIVSERFTKEERLIFLQGFFRSPLNGQLMITSGFGPRNDPFGKGASHHHNGFDYRASIGTNVYAARGGKVSRISSNNILGLYLVIDHENGYQTIYGHLSQFIVVTGQFVTMGMIIAKSGNSGQSTAPHLHFEVRKNGKAVNPTNLLNHQITTSN